MKALPVSAPSRFEAALRRRGFRMIAGVDEAGRGCLAGPVVAAAVILPEDLRLDGVVDSKLLEPALREQVFARVAENALAIGVGVCSPEEIDRLNILWASLEAMRRAVERLAPPADFLLIDGNRTFGGAVAPARAVVKGDRRSLSVAAASIVAKVTRDRMMTELHTSYPQYGWNVHKGYPTPMHYRALEEFGPTPLHRRSFRLTRLPPGGAPVRGDGDGDASL